MGTAGTRTGEPHHGNESRRHPCHPAGLHGHLHPRVHVPVLHFGARVSAVHRSAPAAAGPEHFSEHGQFRPGGGPVFHPLRQHHDGRFHRGKADKGGQRAGQLASRRAGNGRRSGLRSFRGHFRVHRRHGGGAGRFHDSGAPGQRVSRKIHHGAHDHLAQPGRDHSPEHRHDSFQHDQQRFPGRTFSHRISSRACSSCFSPACTPTDFSEKKGNRPNAPAHDPGCLDGPQGRVLVPDAAGDHLRRDLFRRLHGQ